MITVVGVTGLGEVAAGDDLAGLLMAAVELRDGDVLAVTSKIVAKAEGRVVDGERADAVAGETDRVVAQRGPTTIARTWHGLVMAAAGVDASNTPAGTLVLLPRDPDASARALREAIASGGGPNVAVVVTDTSGRAWRNGQTDIAVGAAGVAVLDDHAGRLDPYGNRLAVTAPAVADEVAGAADLATGKLSRSPAALLRGLDRFVLPPGEHGPGAAALVRPEAQDMFGLGSREAVLQSLLKQDARGFGAAAVAEELAATLRRVLPGADLEVEVAADGEAVEVALPAPTTADVRRAGALEERAATAAFALGWEPRVSSDDTVRDTTLCFVPIRP